MTVDRSGLHLTAPPRVVTGVLICTHVYMCCGYFGPPRLTSSGSYAYVLAWAPQQVWGWALVIGAALTTVAPWLNRWGSTIAHTAAALPFAALLVAFQLAQLAHTSEGWGALLMVYPVTGHVLLIAARHHPETTRA